MSALAVPKYIMANNPFWVWPLKLIQACVFQVKKRMMGQPFTKSLFNGTTIKLYPDCPISSAFVYADIPDKDEIMALRAYCQDTTGFIDIGANLGAYSVLLSDRVQALEAFEPDPTSHQRLSSNLSSNQLNARAHQLALSDFVGTASFSDTQGQPTNHLLDNNEAGTTVKVTTLDTIKSEFNHELDYIMKIDVEGFELQVLKGGESFFNEFRVKAVLFESFPEHYKSVEAWFIAHGFQVRHISHHNYLATS